MSRRIIFDIYWATLIPERVAQYKYLGQEGADDSGKELKEAYLNSLYKCERHLVPCR
jgi:hypothetical protein